MWLLWLIYLGGMSIWDIRFRRLPGAGIAAGILLSVWTLAGRILSGSDWKEVLAAAGLGLLPGAFLLLLGWSSGKVGAGDGMLLLLLGMATTYVEALTVLSLGTLFAACYSILGMLLRKLRKTSRIAFVPFLGLGYAACRLILR